MNRRGLLGMLAAAPIFGPAVAKEAAQAAGSIPLAGFSGEYLSWPPTAGVVGGGETNWAARELAALLGKTAAQIAKEKRDIRVTHFDGDIAAMRSLSWHAKVSMQQDRDYDKNARQQQSYFEREIAEFFERTKEQDNG